MDNKGTEQKMIQCILPYETGGEMLKLKDELFRARERILALHPNIEEEYKQKATYSKYSKGYGEYALCPSLVRYVHDKDRYVFNKRANTIPQSAENFYREYVYDKDGNFLKSMLVFEGKASGFIYAVDFEGYKYIFNLGDFANEKDSRFISRMLYKDGKLIRYENYSSCFPSSSHYYSEIYYMADGKEFCTAQSIEYHYETCKPWEDINGEMPDYLRNFYQNAKTNNTEFLENLTLPVTDELSPVRTLIYELTFKNRKIERMDEISLKSRNWKTILPKTPKTPTGLPTTRGATKVLKQMLKENGCTTKNKIAFSAFWYTFKAFALECKYDCSADDLLWEPYHNTIHIARQFCHDDNGGGYDYMEQLNIDIEVDFSSLPKGVDAESFWSEGDFEDFFAKAEGSRVFKAIPSDTIIEVHMVFGKV